MRIRHLLTLVFPVMLAAATAASRAQDEPATQPAIIRASDRDAIDAAMNQEVTVEGVVREAAWSRTGKVMNIEFADAGENGLLAVVFERQRKSMDEAFAGDLAKALTGAEVRLRGTIKPYGGRVESMKGRPQIIIEYPNQITILEVAPATQPATQPG
jgi:DNA/RNA endonuclease YhcR with UshA esterase domain